MVLRFLPTLGGLENRSEVSPESKPSHTACRISLKWRAGAGLEEKEANDVKSRQQGEPTGSQAAVRALEKKCCP